MDRPVPFLLHRDKQSKTCLDRKMGCLDRLGQGLDKAWTGLGQGFDRPQMISEGTFWGTLHGFGCLRCVYACSDVVRKCLCHGVQSNAPFALAVWAGRSDHPTILPTDHPDGPSGRPTIRHVPAERASDRPSHRPTIPHTPTIRHTPTLRSTDDRPTARPTDHPEGPSDHLTDRSPRGTIPPDGHPIDRPSEQPTDSPTLKAPAWATTGVLGQAWTRLGHHPTDRSPRRTIRPNDHPIDRPSEQPTDSPTLKAPAWTTTANRTQTFPPL